MSSPPDSLDRVSTRRRIYLVRHGEVDYFDSTGQPLRTENVPLNERGQRQLAVLGAALREIPFDRVIHSGLHRTKQSATILVDGRDVPFEEIGELREIAPGSLRELVEEEVASQGSGVTFEDVFTGAMTRSIDRATRFLGGESFGVFHDRVVPAFRSLLEDRSWCHLLVVAHGGTNRILLLTALGAELASAARLEQDPACLNIIDIVGRDECLVRLVNHTVHEAVKENLRLTTMEQIFLDYQERIAATRRGAEP